MGSYLALAVGAAIAPLVLLLPIRAGGWLFRNVL